MNSADIRVHKEKVTLVRTVTSVRTVCDIFMALEEVKALIKINMLRSDFCF